MTFVDVLDIPLVRTIAIPLILFTLLNFFLNLTKRAMLRKANTKKQVTNIELFHKLTKYTTWLIIVWVAALSYAGSLTGLGLSLGLFAVIIAWTFMRPLLGVVAWLTILIKQPFYIGDRVKIGDVKGDVTDITLTHIYIRETGGLVHGNEDLTGSLVIVPNAVFFEQSITNYTYKDQYVLEEVSFTITFDSDMDAASHHALAAANKILKKEISDYDRTPFIRTFLHKDGIGMHVRFLAPARNLGVLTSTITYEFMKNIKKERKVKLCSSALME